MMLVDSSRLRALATGATVLGTGGGGDPLIGRLMAEAAIERYGPVRLVTLDELPPEGLVIPVAMMGAPTVMVEKIPSGAEVSEALRQLRRVLGQTPVAMMTIEVGGLDSMIPLAVASEIGLPVVDGDSMGRAFPEIHMTSFSVRGLSATPMVIVDDKGNSIVLETIDNVWAERLARNATVVMGGASIIALYPMTTSQARETAIPGSLSLAIELGEMLNSSRGRAHKLDFLLQRTSGHILFEGKIVEVVRRSTDGFVRGTVSLAGSDSHEGHAMRIEFQNENLVALRDGMPVAMVPDLVSVLDQETLLPITTESLGYGKRVIVIAMPSDPIWQTPEGLATVGPQHFGYDFAYTPLARWPT